MSDRDAPVVFIKVRREGTAESARLDMRLLAFSYKDTDKGADVATITLDNYDLRHFNDPILTDGDILEISFGYPGNLRQTECVIQKITGGTQLKVEAHGKGALMNRERKTRSFRNVKRSDVVKLIAEENGYGDAARDVEDTGDVLQQINQAGMTDATFLAHLARKEGFKFYIDASGLNFHSRRLEQPPRRTFTWFIAEKGDLISFPTIETDITAKPGAVTLKGRDPLTKQDINARADNQSTAGRPGLASTIKLIDKRTGAATLQTRNASEVVQSTTETSQASAERRAAGAFKGSQTAAVKLKATAVGDPQTQAKTNVEFAGIGALISGPYYVSEVTHKVYPPPYTMEMQCRRDGTNGSGRGDSVGAATEAKQNMSKAPSGSDADELEPIEVVDPRSGAKRTEYRPRGASRGAGS